MSGTSEEGASFTRLSLAVFVVVGAVFFCVAFSFGSVLELADAAPGLLKNAIKLFCFIFSLAGAFPDFEPPGAMLSVPDA